MSTGLGQVAVIPGADNFIQWMICRATRSHCAHTIMDIGDGECISAEPGGAKIRPLTDYPTAIWSRYDLTDGQAQAAAAAGRSYKGTPYNWTDDVVIGVEAAFGIRLPRFLENGAWNGRTLECAQLADQALKVAGFQAFDDGRRPYQVYPGSFEHDWVRRGWYTEEFFASFPITPGTQLRLGTAA